ncbi:MAG: endopeptidase La [Deltaproteobacteria bacterium]|nr:endopeptidase La [Deltaproteobacteria bacterium]
MDEIRTLKPQSVKLVPLLPLRDIIIFPHMVVPLFVGREKSINALEEAMNSEKDILLVAQVNAKTNDPRPDDIYKVGTLGTIIQLLRLPDGTVKVLVEGKKRARIQRFVSFDHSFTVEVEEIAEDHTVNIEIEALMRSLKATFETYVKLNKRIPPEMLASVAVIDDPARLADTIVAHLHLKLPDKQKILEIDAPKERLEKLYGLMQAEIEILQVEKKIRTRVKKQMEKTQKEYYLNEQMQAIQKELGERDEFKSEIQELEEKMKKKRMSEEATEKVKKEIKKLKMMSPMSAEATVVRNYIDWVLSLPWADMTKEKNDIKEAEVMLDEDHYGLEKAKERIVEYLAVQKLVGKMKGPILCFVGPPGVGKTSLAKSIARATNRKFVRQSLGGVRDEAEIRGHRRTYIGALPGKVIQSLKKAGANNPVFLLDEVDKMSMDFRGDPSAALLEVLDPEQNSTFNDHYLDMDYDLSHVMFITTANTLQGIPIPLQDRMEIIRISGYTEYEKLEIAKKYLVPKQMEANGLKPEVIEFADNGIKMIIRRYTREAGVRNLEREIATVCRKVAKKIAETPPEEFKKMGISARSIPNYLGIPKFRFGSKEEKDEVGITTGLAWTEVGGELLSTEVSVMPGKGKLTITGKLGEVMQESAQAAMSYVRTRALQFGLDRDFYQKVDIHVHVPEGAIPKDGPSAGITMATTIVSALLRVPVRREVAMTGEITLRGKVLPIGGLKEKLLAAHRGLIKTIIIPKENEKDLKEVPKKILSSLKIICVENMDDVLKHALNLPDPDKIFKMKDINIVMEEIYPKKTPPPPPPPPEAKPEVVTH